MDLEKLEIETLHCDGDLCSFMVKADVDEDEFKNFLVDKEWLESIPKHAKIQKGWHRKVPARNECGEHGGWILHDAKAKARGAFFATQLIVY